MVSITQRTVFQTRRAQKRLKVFSFALPAAVLCKHAVAAYALAVVAVHQHRYLKSAKRTHHKDVVTQDYHDDMFGDVLTKNYFRFHKQDMEELRICLGIPDRVKVKKQFNVSGAYALRIFLYRLARAGTWPATMAAMCNLHPTQMSRIFHHVADHVYGKLGHTVTDIRKWAPYADELARASVAKGCPYHHCIGFIDCTFRHVPRPVCMGVVAGGQQGQVYNRHYKGHGLKYQAVQLPNGFVGDMYGPIEGALHDARLYSMSGLEGRMQALHVQTGINYIIYGDSAYALTQYLQPAIRMAHGAARQLNRTMSGHLIVVEWLFGNMTMQWRFLDDEQNQKINKNAPGKVFICCAIMHNLFNIEYGNQIRYYFNCDAGPKTMWDYCHNF